MFYMVCEESEEFGAEAAVPRLQEEPCGQGVTRPGRPPRVGVRFTLDRFGLRHGIAASMMLPGLRGNHSRWRLCVPVGHLSIELPVARIRGGVLGRRQADADPAAPNRRLVEDASHDDGRRPGGRVAGVVVVPPRDAGSLAHLAVKPGGLVVAADDRAPGAEAHGTGRCAGDRSPKPAGRGSQAASPRQSAMCRGTASPP